MKFSVGDEVVYHETGDDEGYGKDFNGTKGVIVNINDYSRWFYTVEFANYKGIFPCSEDELSLDSFDKSIEEFL